MRATTILALCAFAGATLWVVHSLTSDAAATATATEGRSAIAPEGAVRSAQDLPNVDGSVAPALDAAGDDAPSERTPSGAAESGADDEPAGITVRALPPTTDQNALSVVHGVVTTVDGRPVSKPWLVLHDESGDRDALYGDEHGRYLFVDVPSGVVRVSIGGTSDWIGQERLVEIEPGDNEQIDFTVRPIHTIGLRCRTTDGQRFYDGVREQFHHAVRFQPLVTQDRPPTVLDPPHPGGNNSYGVGSWWDRGHIRQPTIDAEDDFGVLLVNAEFPVWASLALGNVVVHTQRVDTNASELEWVLDPAGFHQHLAALRFRTLDDVTGEPIDAHLRIDNVYRPEPVHGEAEQTGLMPGPHRIHLRSEGRATRVFNVDLVAGETLDLGDIRMSEPVTLSGRVKSAEGAPVQVDLRVRCESNGAQHSCSTKPDGTFVLRGLVRDRYTLRIIADDERRFIGAPDTIWSSHTVTADARSGDLSDLLLVALPVTRVSVRSTIRTAPMKLAVRSPDGGVLRRRTLRPGRSVDLKLPRGRTVLVGTRESEEVFRQELEISTEPQSVRVDLP